MKKVIGISLSLIVFVCVLFWASQNKEREENLLSVINHQKIDNTTQMKEYHTEAVIAGIGDILIHDFIYEDAKTQQGYNFDPMFEPVSELLKQPDFLIANQESVPGGSEIGISNYPLFNSPHEIVDSLQNAGVDMVTTANNHMLDKGERGLLSAIEYYEKVGLPYTGTFKNPQDKETIRILPINGIQIAVLSYSYGTNGIPVPKGKDYLVSLIDPVQIIKDIHMAKEKADIVLLALHWGDEYIREPNQTQKELAHQFIQEGADVIFGHHPHVLQPIEWINRKDGEKGLVIYSLGNFLSGQIRNYKDIGGMIEVTIEKKITGKAIETNIKHVEFHPTFTANRNFKEYRIYPLSEANKKGLTNISHQNIIDFMFPN